MVNFLTSGMQGGSNPLTPDPRWGGGEVDPKGLKIFTFSVPGVGLLIREGGRVRPKSPRMRLLPSAKWSIS